MITAGSGLTVSITCALQPVPKAYVMVVVPAAIPVATPVLASIAATVVSLLTQLPPGVVLPKVVVSPSHTCRLPVTPAGIGFTVMFLVD